jgi:hypothetical protein
VAAHGPRVVDLDGTNASAAEGLVDPAADGLYFGKFWHRSSMGLRERAAPAAQLSCGCFSLTVSMP